MTDPRPKFRDRVPIIQYDIPPDDQQAVNAIGRYLHSLEKYVSDFHAALELYDFAEAHHQTGIEGLPANVVPRLGYTLDVTSNWPFMAGREGAMAIDHFRVTMLETNRLVRSIPSLSQHVDFGNNRIAIKLFNAFFSNADLIRNSIAHEAESLFHVSDNTNASTRTSTIRIMHSLVGRQYVTTYRDQTFSYTLSLESLDKINRVKIRYFAGFAAVDLRTNLPDL